MCMYIYIVPQYLPVPWGYWHGATKGCRRFCKPAYPLRSPIGWEVMFEGVPCLAALDLCWCVPNLCCDSSIWNVYIHPNINSLRICIYMCEYTYCVNICDLQMCVLCAHWGTFSRPDIVAPTLGEVFEHCFPAPADIHISLTTLDASRIYIIYIHIYESGPWMRHGPAMACTYTDSMLSQTCLRKNVWYVLATG